MSALLKESSAGGAHLATLGRGFAQPVHAAQQVFRAVLEAMSRPGRVQALPSSELAALEPPGLSRGLISVLLSLLDAETSLWLAPPLDTPAALAYLRFHTGVRVHERPQAAAFVAMAAAQARADLWATLNAGSDEAPQSGTTLIVEVDALASTAMAGAPVLELRGPGIADRQSVCVAGLAADFWRAREAMASEYPRGIDLILCCGEHLAALPRTTRVSLED